MEQLAIYLDPELHRTVAHLLFKYGPGFSVTETRPGIFQPDFFDISCVQLWIWYNRTFSFMIPHHVTCSTIRDVADFEVIVSEAFDRACSLLQKTSFGSHPNTRLLDKWRELRIDFFWTFYLKMKVLLGPNRLK